MAPLTFVIIPGSFATPASYTRLEAALRQKGQDVQVVGLLSANDGTRRPAPKMEDDAEHIRAAVTSILDSSIDPKNVVMLLHSYSGIPGSSALKGLGKTDRAAEGKATAVVGIVYLGSFLAPLGSSVRDIMGEFDAMPEPAKTGVPGDYLPVIDKAFIPLLFNDLKDQAEIDEAFAGMTQHSSDTYSGKLSYEAWKYIPTVQIIPQNDAIVPVPIQEAMHERVKAAGVDVQRVFVEGAGHALNISMPERVAAEMIALAERVREW
ncbi:alpha/beta-hydrolase [Thozetella sp. PMI_491]|nr:alpha/beta-hydrolase [Thozetella sp. PMI_491]